MDKRFSLPVGFLAVFAASPMIDDGFRLFPSSGSHGAGESAESSRPFGANMVKKVSRALTELYDIK